MAIKDESLFAYKGHALPFRPFCYQYPDYFKIRMKDKKRKITPVPT
ncbi:MAG: hypothetical protein SPJ76_01680 [Candidatus Enterosoma sp.]|nr:hypothetical protein [Candidatus Enterosoma sp.]